MARLFILGNGYDLAKGEKSSYDDFRKWLLKQYPEIKEECENNKINFSDIQNVMSISTTILKSLKTKNENAEREKQKLCKLEEQKRQKLVIKILFYLFYAQNLQWSEFEENLSKLSIKKIIEDNKKNYSSSSDKTIYNFVDKTTSVVSSLYSEICSLFVEWVNQIGRKNIQKTSFDDEIIKKIEPDDTFIIFNYTTTVEKTFNCNDSDKIFHIHGIKDNKESIVFGHNHKNKSKPTNLNSYEEFIQDFYACLYKNPEYVIDKNSKLWERLNSYETLDVYEFGWKCSDVDGNYIDKLVDILKNKKVHLYLNNFEDEGHEKKKQWEKYGFDSKSIILYEVNGNNIKIIE